MRRDDVTLEDLVIDLLDCFDMGEGLPTCEFYSAGEPYWGTPNGEIADILYDLKQLVDSAKED